MSKKIKSSLQVFNIAMFIATCGVAYYVGSYVPNQAAANKQIVYVAKEDVLPNILIDKNVLSKSFEAKPVSKGDALPSYFISTDKPVYTTNKVSRGEPLMLTQLKYSQENDGDYEIKLQPSYSGRLEKNDYVQVFAQIVNGKTGESSIYTLFPKKQIKTIDYADESIGNISGVYVSVTEKELTDYYKAQEKGKIILGKLTDVDLRENANKENPSKDNLIDFESEEFKNAEVIVKDNEIAKTDNIEEQPTVVEDSNQNTQVESKSIEIEEYTVLKGETWKGIAAKNGTDVQTLKEINVGIEITENQVIFVPVK